MLHALNFFTILVLLELIKIYAILIGIGLYILSFRFYSVSITLYTGILTKFCPLDSYFLIYKQILLIISQSP
jgi:hypothetical protein